MKSLYINTTGKILSLAFKNDDDFFEYKGNEEVSQSENIFPEIKKLLGTNSISDLDFIVVLGGPGSFTGIRLGLSIAKGFNIAIGVPIITLNNFMASFYSLQKKFDAFYITLTAGLNDVYIAKFDKNGNELESGKIIKKDCIDNLIPVFENPEILPKVVLKVVEGSFNKKDFKQMAIEPTYIKPHYAKIKNK